MHLIRSDIDDKYMETEKDRQEIKIMSYLQLVFCVKRHIIRQDKFIFNFFNFYDVDSLGNILFYCY